jgi:hypothetical protein
LIASMFWYLARRREPLSRAVLAGAAGYVIMASFNNPLLFVQISAVVFTIIGFGLAFATRHDATVADASSSDDSGAVDAS